MNQVRVFREQKGLTQATLAEAAGIARQSLGSIEAGRADPSVSVALKLARALDTTVDELFGGAEDAEQLEAELAAPWPLAVNTRVALGFLGERWVAHPIKSQGNEAADGLVGSRRARAGGPLIWVDTLRPAAVLRDNFILVGCAPPLGLLVTRLNVSPGPGHFVWSDRPSLEALEALRKRQAHAAGVHLPSPVELRGARGAGARFLKVTLVHWETGLVVPQGNPLGIHDITDLARPGLRLCVRPREAGSQRLLEDLLRSRGLEPELLFQGAQVAEGHFSAAHRVAVGAADVALAMQGAALALGLELVPLAVERFDLLLPEESRTDARVQRLVELMNTPSFKQELGALGGYDTRECGRVVEA